MSALNFLGANVWLTLVWDRIEFDKRIKFLSEPEDRLAFAHAEGHPARSKFGTFNRSPFLRAD